MNENPLTIVREEDMRRLLRGAALLESLCDVVEQEELEEAGEAETPEDIQDRLLRLQSKIPFGSRKLHLVPGLSGSGKTTLAWRLCAQQDPGLVLVSRQDLRTVLFGESDLRIVERERLVRRCLETAVIAAVASGVDVVCDDALLDQLTLTRLMGLASDLHLEVVVHTECLRVPVEECIRRNAERSEAGAGKWQILADAPMVTALWGEYL